MAQDQPIAWICSICGYVHYGPEPPAECPVCGAPREEFVLQTVEAPAQGAPTTVAGVSKVLIVGAGIAGISAAEELRKAGSTAEIQILSSESDLPYYRLNLTRYLAGEVKTDQFALHPQEWYTQNRIVLRGGVEVTGIDPSGHTIQLLGGESLPYERLILATGARPSVPPIPGAQLGKVFTLRTRQDADAILENARGKQVVCIGGGLLGLETAGALARQGATVTVLETLPWLMPRQLNPAAAGIFQRFIEGLGISVRTGIKVKELAGDHSIRSLQLEDGSVITAGLVVISAGVQPNITLAAQAGLKVNRGILVDDSMRTSNPDILAAGDVAEHAGMLYGTWAPALAQGIVAGSTVSEEKAVFKGLPRSNMLKVLGIELFSVGDVTANQGDVLIEEFGQNSYFGFIFRGGILAAAILLGDSSQAVRVKKAVEDHLNCSEVLEGKPSSRELLAFIVSKTNS